MDDRSRIGMSAMVGAVAGAVVGYLYLTEGGRRFREQIEPRLDDFLREIRQMRGTVERAREVATEGWRSLNEVVGEGGSRWEGGPRRQTSH